MKVVPTGGAKPSSSRQRRTPSLARDLETVELVRHGTDLRGGHQCRGDDRLAVVILNRFILLLRRSVCRERAFDAGRRTRLACATPQSR